MHLLQDINDGKTKVYSFEYADGVVDMAAHSLGFSVVMPARLDEDLVGNEYFSDLRQRSGQGQPGQLTILKSKLSAQGNGIAAKTTCMPKQEGSQRSTA